MFAGNVLRDLGSVATSAVSGWDNTATHAKCRSRGMTKVSEAVEKKLYGTDTISTKFPYIVTFGLRGCLCVRNDQIYAPSVATKSYWESDLSCLHTSKEEYCNSLVGDHGGERKKSSKSQACGVLPIESFLFFSFLFVSFFCFVFFSSPFFVRGDFSLPGNGRLPGWWRVQTNPATNPPDR